MLYWSRAVCNQHPVKVYTSDGAKTFLTDLVIIGEKNIWETKKREREKYLSEENDKRRELTRVLSQMKWETERWEERDNGLLRNRDEKVTQIEVKRKQLKKCLELKLHILKPPLDLRNQILNPWIRNRRVSVLLIKRYQKWGEVYDCNSEVYTNTRPLSIYNWFLFFSPRSQHCIRIRVPFCFFVFCFFMFFCPFSNYYLKKKNDFRKEQRELNLIPRCTIEAVHINMKRV